MWVGADWRAVRRAVLQVLTCASGARRSHRSSSVLDGARARGFVVRLACAFALAVAVGSAASADARASSYSDGVLAEPSLAGYWRLADQFSSTATASRGPSGAYGGMPALGADGLAPAKARS